MTNELEALQLENNQIKEHNRLLVGWISLLSHDTKQLFSTLSWIIEAYENKIVSSEDFFKMLPQIKKDAQKNLKVATDTSEWLKTQYGAFKPQQDVSAGFELFAHLKEDFSSKLEAKQLSFEFTGDPNSYVIADKVLLTFVLKRIVDNAIKYSHKQNIISFSIANNTEEVVISVTDYGTGMNERSKLSMYSFESALFEGTAGEIGSGLSLKIAQYFVFLMQGTIQIESLQNKGTTVKINLPHTQ